jgi:hypothetical protein
VLRDKPVPVEKDLVLVANGWLSNGPLPKRSQFARVHYAGIHLSPEYQHDEHIAEFIDAGTIGCRDTYTLDFLKSKGLPAELCRCATLTFPRYDGERRGVLAVNVSEKTASRAMLKHAVGEKIVYSKHYVDRLSENCVADGSFVRRLREAYDRLQQYRVAKLVITSKIHVTLPCIAFGTPVIYVGPRDVRYGVLDGIEPPDWRTLRWFRMGPAIWQASPSAVDAGFARQEYLEFLRRELGQIASETNINELGESPVKA